MHTTTFDTLEFIEQLRAAGVPEEQAKVHTKGLAMVIKQIDNRADEQADRLSDRNEKQIRGRLDGLATKQEMDFRLATVEANLKRDIAILDGKVETTKAELRKEIEIAKTETIKWMIGLALAQLAMMAGILMTLVRVLPVGH